MAESGISNDEINLYDRQIRLWGIDGQKRLRESQILILGLGALAVEVAKNLVLAGIGSLTIQSAKPVTEESLGGNFFVRAENIGMNLVEAARVRIQRLNPRVAVVSETRDLHDIPDNWFNDFDIIISTEGDFKSMSRVSRLARTFQKAFYGAGLHGWAGFIFVDLIEHEFVVEKQCSNVPTPQGSVSQTQTIVDVKVEEGVEKIRVREVYVSLEEALRAATSVPLGMTMKPRARARVSPYLPAFLASWDVSSISSADIAAKCDALGLPKTLASPEFVEEFSRGYGVEISAVAAVVGGMVAQEAINFLTLREYPIQNLFIYDARRSAGPIFHLY